MKRLNIIKKLIFIFIVRKDIYYINYNINIIMNQEDLLQFLHTIHNKIRNANGLKLTGMSALNEINNYFALYFIKDKVVSKGKLSEDYSFDKIYEKYCTDDIIKSDRKKLSMEFEDTFSYKLWYDVYSAGNDKCIMRKIIENDYFKQYFVTDISRISAYASNSKSRDTIQEIFNMIYKKFKDTEFTYKVYDALGSAYEKFKTDEISNSGKHTGQHFTPVSIKKIIIDELKPTYEEKFYEPCAGSGGFIHTACHYVYDNDKKNLEKFKKKLYANEINPEIQKPLMINMLLHDIPVSNFNLDKECDSLSVENCKRYKNKMDVCATNVPFGVKTTITDFDDYWEPVKSSKQIIKDSTAQFIVHIHNCLKNDGRAGVVVDRGILNNGTDGKKSWQKKFRQWLLENNDLYKIILLPTGIFDFTNFATAILFFNKDTKTKKVDIYEATFIDAKKKGDIVVCDKPLKSMTIGEIEKQNWSLKIEMEEKEEIKEGFVKLCDIILYVKYKSKDASVVNNNGKYIYYSSSIINYQYTNEYTNNDECLIINKTNGSGKSKIFFNKKDQKFCASSATIIFKFKNNININFAYYYMQFNIDKIQKLYTGSDKKSLNNSSFELFQIPNLSLSHQQEIVDFLDKQFETYDINVLTDKLKDIKIFDLLIAKKYDVCEDVLHLIYRKIETDALIKSMERDKKATFNLLLNGTKYDTFKLGDVIESKCGTKINMQQYLIKKSCYGIVRTRNIDTNDNDFLYISKDGINNCKNAIISENDILLSSFVEPFHVQIANKSWAGYTYNGGVFRITNTCQKMKNIFLLYLLKYSDLSMKLKNISHGGTVKMFNMNDLNKQIIKLPSLKDQEKLVEEVENIEKEQTTYKKYSENIQKILDNMQEIINKTLETNNIQLDKSDERSCTEKDDTDTNNGTEDDTDDKSDSDISNSDTEEAEEVPIKKKVIKKLSKKSTSDSDTETEEVPIKKKKNILVNSSESDSSDESSNEKKHKYKFKK